MEKLCVCSYRASRTTDNLVERVRSILASKDLSLHQVSCQSETLYGRSLPYFLPHNLYFALRSGISSPSIYQLFALSRISGYRLADWLLVFGFNLEDLPRLQILLPSTRTVLLNSSLDDHDSWVPWLENKRPANQIPAVAPLTQLLEFTHYRRLWSLLDLGGQGYLYAKIGNDDVLPFPDLLPGSIVRINPRIDDGLISRENGTTSSRVFFIQHSKGLFCCRMRTIDDGVIVPVSTQLSYAQIELHVPDEAKLLGVVDLEIRPTLNVEQPEVPNELSEHWKPEILTPEPKLGHLLRNSRTRLGLSLREASTMTRRIADLLGDERYLISQSSLSDYEVLDTPPRHFHKAISLCALYGLQFSVFLRAIGIVPEHAGTESMPDSFVARSSPQSIRGRNNKVDDDGFLQILLKECGGVPFFLRNTIEEISGLSPASLHNFIWIGGERRPLHPYLTNGLLVLVNRRKRTPIYLRSKPLWQQPIYVIQKRDGTYLCACCGVENGTLVVHPYSPHFYRPIQLRNHHDAEVIGQIVAIARKLL
jgi:hypothetical protein